MEERQEGHEFCSVCGDTLKQEPRTGSLCEACTDAWEREVDCHW